MYVVCIRAVPHGLIGRKKKTIGLHESANLTHWVHEDQLWVLTLPFVTSQRANLTNTACSLEMGSKQNK